MIDVEGYEIGFVLGSLLYFVMTLIVYNEAPPVMVGGLIGTAIAMVARRIL